MKLIFFLIFLFYSCDHKGDLTKQNKEIIKIKIDKKTHQKENMNLFHFLENPRFVKLETNPKALIRRINKVIQYRNNIFIFDRRFNSLYRFDNKGKFLNKVSKDGQGPGELRQLIDFEVDTLYKEVLLIGSSLNTIHLDFEGNFLHNDLKKEAYPNRIAVLGDRKYAYDLNYSALNYNNLFIFDIKENTIHSYFPFEKGMRAIAFEDYGGLKRNYEGILYSEIASSIIHQLKSNGEHYPKYQIESYQLKAWAEKDRYNLEAFRKSHKDISKLKNSYQENKNAFLYEVSDAGHPTKFIYFKNNKQLYSFKSFFKRSNKTHFSSFILSSPRGLSFQNKFISVISLGKYDYYKKQTQKGDEDLLIGDNPLYPILRNSAPDDNPILCIYDVKEPKNGK